MPKMMSMLVVLVAVLLCHLQVSTAIEGSGTLAMLDITDVSYSTLLRQDDVTSGYISISSGFRFGTSTYYSIYVNTNGYVSLGEEVTTTSPRIPGSSEVISPYGADIDTEITGTVRYTRFVTYHPEMSTVSSFIRSETGDYFYGSRMMIVEWDRVARFGGSSSTTSTFQAVLITDGSASYAVFIYQCGGMEWGGATIGWTYSSSLYEKHTLSGSNSDVIGCYYSSSSSAIVYDVYSEPYTTSYPTATSYCYYYECANGDCVLGDRCDNYDDCRDNSDEDGCVNVALAVGLSIGICFLLIIIGVPVCVVVTVYWSNRRRRLTRTRIVATTPVSGATVVASTGNTSFATPTAYPSQPYYSAQPPPAPYPSSQPAPATGYPPQPEMKYGDAPPSYDALAAYPPQGYPQFQPNPVHAYPPQPYPPMGPQSGYPTTAPYPTQDNPPPTQNPSFPQQ